MENHFSAAAWCRLLSVLVPNQANLPFCRWPTRANPTTKASPPFTMLSAGVTTTSWTFWFASGPTSVLQTATAGKSSHSFRLVMLSLRSVTESRCTWVLTLCPSGRRCIARPPATTVLSVSFWWEAEGRWWPWQRVTAPLPPRNVTRMLSALRSARTFWEVRSAHTPEHTHTCPMTLKWFLRWYFERQAGHGRSNCTNRASASVSGTMRRA